MKRREVTVEEREYDLRMAESDLEAIAEAWTRAKAGRQMSSTLERGMDDAQRRCRRAQSRLEATRKRLARKQD